MIETWDDFVRKVTQWASDRNLIKGSTVQAQGLKGLSEAGELADNFAKGKDIRDDIGDCCVVAVITMLQEGAGKEKYPVDTQDDMCSLKAIASIAQEFTYCITHSFSADGVPDYAATLCKNVGINFIECLNTAWNDIKDRKGIMHNGVFIKESDPRYKELVHSDLTFIGSSLAQSFSKGLGG